MECEDQDTQQRDPKTHEMYINVMRRFSQALLKVSTRHTLGTRREVALDAPVSPLSLSNTLSLQGDKSVRVMRSLLASQQTFVDRLVQLMKAVQRESGNRKKKVRPADGPSRHTAGHSAGCRDRLGVVETFLLFHRMANTPWLNENNLHISWSPFQ